MSVMATTSGYRRYMVRHGETAAKLFTVEAKDQEQAIARANQVNAVINLADERTTLVVEESSAIVPVPNFMQGYYAMLDRMA